MGENSKIQWTHHTGGPWLICTEVSPGCAHCYARELMLTRLAPIVRKAYKAGFEDWKTRPVWGKRVLTKGFWDDARRLNNKAATEDTRFRMFPSMIDWLDEMPAGIIDQDGKWLDAIVVLADFLKLIHDTPNLDWLLLTKRPENFAERLTRAWHNLSKRGLGEDTELVRSMMTLWEQGKSPFNVWIGASAEDQPRADERIPELLKIPAKVRFLSVEPMLGPIRFDKVKDDELGANWNVLQMGIDWVIFGGESNGRPCNIDWIRDGVRQCRAAGVKVFVKQLGSNPIIERPDNDAGDLYPFPVSLRDKKGGDIAEFPADLQVREFPQ